MNITKYAKVERYGFGVSSSFMTYIEVVAKSSQVSDTVVRLKHYYSWIYDSPIYVIYDNDDNQWKEYFSGMPIMQISESGYYDNTFDLYYDVDKKAFICHNLVIPFTHKLAFYSDRINYHEVTAGIFSEIINEYSEGTIKNLTNQLYQHQADGEQWYEDLQKAIYKVTEERKRKEAVAKTAEDRIANGFGKYSATPPNIEIHKSSEHTTIPESEIQSFIDSLDFTQAISSLAKSNRREIANKLLDSMEKTGVRNGYLRIQGMYIPKEQIIKIAHERFQTNDIDLINRSFQSSNSFLKIKEESRYFLYFVYTDKTHWKYTKSGLPRDEYQFEITKYGESFKNELQHELARDGIEIGQYQIEIKKGYTYSYIDFVPSINSNEFDGSFSGFAIPYWASERLINYAKEKKVLNETPPVNNANTEKGNGNHPLASTQNSTNSPRRRNNPTLNNIVNNANTESAPKNDLKSLYERAEANSPWPRYKKACPKCGNKLKRGFFKVTCPNCGWWHL